VGKKTVNIPILFNEYSQKRYPNFAIHVIDEIYNGGYSKIVKIVPKTEIESIICEYIDSTSVNPIYLEKILHFPNSRFESIIDAKNILKAKRRYEEIVEKIFTSESAIEKRIEIKYERNLENTIYYDDSAIDRFFVNLDWIESHLDFPTLWNNFIFIIEVFDRNMRLTYSSTRKSIGFFDLLQSEKPKHIYNDTNSFRIIDYTGELLIRSYIDVLQSYDVRIEEMIEWFFNDYLKQEHNIENFNVIMPEENHSYITKNKLVLPEIERIFTRFNCLVDNGFVDNEIVEELTYPAKINNVKSLIENKYIYIYSKSMNSICHILFSNQSPLSYIMKSEKSFETFYEHLINESLFLNDFAVYQLSSITFLVENGIILVDDKNRVNVCNQSLLNLLEDLFYNEVLCYHHLSPNEKTIIDSLLKQSDLVSENTLFSKKEHDYFNFYMNRMFSNGYNLRNRYLHGTNPNNEASNKDDYYKILKILIIIILRINEDLNLYSKSKLI
jgi:hypothetical protein